MEVKGHLKVNDKAVKQPGRVYATNGSTFSVTTSELDVTVLTALTLDPPPNGVRKYRVTMFLPWASDGTSEVVTIKLYLGANGTKADTTPIKTWIDGTRQGDGSNFFISHYQITPTAAQVKAGLSLQIAAGPNDMVADSFLEIEELVE